MQAVELIQLITAHQQNSLSSGGIPLIAIIGPTASGKTALSLELADYFGGEVISADSRQIYQEMDIGTGKATAEEQARVKHHLISIIRPDQEFSLASYQKNAFHHLEQISAKGKLPFLVGGTGLYVSAVIKDFSLPSAPPDPQLRAQLMEYAEVNGPEKLHAILHKLDEKVASNIHPNNQRYVIRAIEIALSEAPKTVNKFAAQSPYQILFLGIEWPREELYSLIEKRVDQQIEAGLLDETKQLIQKYSLDLPSMSALGYRELAAYLAGEVAIEEAVQTFKQFTRNYAKRQMTWFRKYQDVNWINGAEFSNLISQLRQLNQI